MKGYAKVSPIWERANYDGSLDLSSNGLVKEQVIKNRFGIELEKVAYYDYKGRKMLTEHHEGHKLTHLRLIEYDNSVSIPVAKWLLVRGDYLRHVTQPSLAAANKKTAHYFNSIPAVNEGE